MYHYTLRDLFVSKEYYIPAGVPVNVEPAIITGLITVICIINGQTYRITTEPASVVTFTDILDLEGV